MRARQGMEQRASQVWASAGRAHLFTERESVGGRVWPNVNFDDKRIDYAFALWGNSAWGSFAIGGAPLVNRRAKRP